MAASISNADALPDKDYSVAHRAPPPVPSVAYTSTVSSNPPRTYLTNNESFGGSASGYASESASVNTETAGRPRRGSFGKVTTFLRRTSSTNKEQISPVVNSPNNTSDVPPVPSVPATRITQLHQQASTSGSGRNMLRKSSKMRREEQERLEQERLTRARQPPPRLPTHNPLPGIDSFGGEQAATSPQLSTSSYTTSPQQQQPSAPLHSPNFSRPGNAFAQGMPSSTTPASSSSPAYAIRTAKQESSSPDLGVKGTRGTGEYVSSSTYPSIHRSESMANRGRYSYASSTVNVNAANSPRRVRRRKDPTPFNVLIIGAKNSGKTSFISFLRHSLALPIPSSNSSRTSNQPEPSIGGNNSSFISHYIETEMDGERVGLTLWDSAGLEKNIVDLQLREMSAFVESKFEDTFVEEQKVMRSPGVKDTHIHCAFLILDPVKLDANVAASSSAKLNGVNLSHVSGLDDDVDLQVLRSLWGKTTVIPVISKADTLTIGHMAFLKRAVWDSIKAAKLDPLEALELEDDNEDIDEENEDEDEDTNAGSSYIDDFVNNTSDAESTDSKLSKPIKKPNGHVRHSSLSLAAAKNTAADQSGETPYIPMSILSPDPYDLPPYNIHAKPGDKVGRRFPWGTADPYDPYHSDFTRLRDSVFVEWRAELRELSRSKWYENWRTSRLRNVPGTKQRTKGGVTPVAAVPKEGRSVSAAMNGNADAGAEKVPRSVSGPVTNANIGVVKTKAEKMMGIESRGGAHRNVG